MCQFTKWPELCRQQEKARQHLYRRQQDRDWAHQHGRQKPIIGDHAEQDAPMLGLLRGGQHKDQADTDPARDGNRGEKLMPHRLHQGCTV